ncbi:MAG TPA: tRNA epoxyqueuosine(34) reductase QueG [Opitutaceae bacterium]|jgi:epoxyqueuosine reductase
MAPRQEELRRRLLELGFDEARFARLGPIPDGGALRRWLDSGKHADMEWMDSTAQKRADPGLVLAGARSAVLLGVDYYSQRTPEPSAPVWARYSLYEDYHDTVKPALARAGALLGEVMGAAPCDYRYYVDTGPVLERAWAARAGVGFIGKNAMLISRTRGNWLFLACILTTLDLDPDPPVRGRGEPGSVGLLCGKCTRCMDACPTSAFDGPGVLDARRCISYQTIENRGIIPAHLREAIGMRVYGCDTCLDVCPWNRFAQGGRRMLLSARDAIAELSLRDLLEMTPARFAEAFRRTAVKRIKLTGLLRNACVAAGNSGDSSLIGPLLALAAHPSAIVRAHAVWAVHRLGAAGRLAGCRAVEGDAQVLAEYASPSDSVP